MNELVKLHQKYLWHAERIYKRGGVNYYVCAAQAVEMLMLR